MFVPVDFSFPNTPGGAIAPPGEGQGGQMARCPPPVSAPEQGPKKYDFMHRISSFSAASSLFVCKDVCINMFNMHVHCMKVTIL